MMWRWCHCGARRENQLVREWNLLYMHVHCLPWSMNLFAWWCCHFCLSLEFFELLDLEAIDVVTHTHKHARALMYERGLLFLNKQSNLLVRLFKANQTFLSVRGSPRKFSFGLKPNHIYKNNLRTIFPKTEFEKAPCYYALAFASSSSFVSAIVSSTLLSKIRLFIAFLYCNYICLFMLLHFLLYTIVTREARKCVWLSKQKYSRGSIHRADTFIYVELSQSIYADATNCMSTQ